MPAHGWAGIVMEKLNFKKNNKGSVLILTAILIPVFILITGMVVDIGRSLVYKEELNKACMVAAEEASKIIDMDEAQNSGTSILTDKFAYVIEEYFYKNYNSKDYCTINYLNYEITGGMDNPKYLRVSCEAYVKCFFLKIVGINDILIHSQACGRLRRLSGLLNGEFYCL